MATTDIEVFEMFLTEWGYRQEPVDPQQTRPELVRQHERLFNYPFLSATFDDFLRAAYHATTDAGDVVHKQDHFDWMERMKEAVKQGESMRKLLDEEMATVRRIFAEQGRSLMHNTTSRDDRIREVLAWDGNFRVRDLDLLQAEVNIASFVMDSYILDLNSVKMMDRIAKGLTEWTQVCLCKEGSD